MMKELFIFKGDRLTELARSIFGDIVEAAYYCEKPLDDSQIQTCAMGIEERDVNMHFVIKFTNGKNVYFNSSEFMSVCDPYSRNLKLVELQKRFDP